jgi:hypothetical protein
MDQLTAARIQTVRDHMRLECESDWDGVIATFAHPRYELYGAGTVFDGEEAVRGYFAASRNPLPRPGQRDHRDRHGRRHRAGRILADGHPSGSAADAERRNRSYREGVSGADDGELRIRPRLGQNYLRAALFRPPRSHHGARARLSGHPLSLNRCAKRFIPGLIGTAVDCAPQQNASGLSSCHRSALNPLL